MRKASQSIDLAPQVLRWARERAGLEPGELAGRLRVPVEEVERWEATGRITFRQVDDLSSRTYTPVGYLYLPEPPDDSLPIKDFRTRSGKAPTRPSPNLLDTVYQMQRRQGWMSEEMIREQESPTQFVGSVDLTASPQSAAAVISEALGLPGGWAAAEGTWSNALRALRDHIDAAGVLVVFNGVVGNNTRRRLDPDEFQGFTLVDHYAPLIFVNGSDYNTAQMFTLAHELAHIFVGEPGLSRFQQLSPSDHEIETVCNRIAAEFLIPRDELRERWRAKRNPSDQFHELARHFKVSTIVAARRALDIAVIEKETFFDFYYENRANAWGGRSQSAGTGGGDFWKNQEWRLGTRFASAVSRAVSEGRMSHTRAYRLTGLSGDAFASLPEKMGFGG